MLILKAVLLGGLHGVLLRLQQLTGGQLQIQQGSLYPALYRLENQGLIASEEAIVEIVRTGTGDPVAEGSVGEVVVTTFNRDYPLVRFATGDLSAALPGPSPCGRSRRFPASCARRCPATR